MCLFQTNSLRGESLKQPLIFWIVLNKSVPKTLFELWPVRKPSLNHFKFDTVQLKLKSLIHRSRKLTQVASLYDIMKNIKGYIFYHPSIALLLNQLIQSYLENDKSNESIRTIVVQRRMSEFFWFNCLRKNWRDYFFFLWIYIHKLMIYCLTCKLNGIISFLQWKMSRKSILDNEVLDLVELRLF